MKNKPQLILDAAGVLVSNLSPMFWRQIASLSGEVSSQQLKDRFNLELRVDFWSGRVAENQFWLWLVQKGMVKTSLGIG